LAGAVGGFYAYYGGDDSPSDPAKLQPTSETKLLASLVTSPQSVGAGTHVRYRTQEEAKSACDGPVFFNAGFVCVNCPDGSTYEPSSDRCMACGVGADAFYRHPSETVLSVRRPEEIILGHKVECRECPADAADQIAVGQMKWVLTSDASRCARCTGRSRPLRCQNDSDCLVLGAATEYRCSPKKAWNGRRNGLETSVCVPRCASNADCPGGSCDLRDENDDGIPDGICLSSGFGIQTESIAAEDLACVDQQG
jgi:hypothetical protein